MNNTKYTDSNYMPNENTSIEIENLNKEKQDLSNFNLKKADLENIYLVDASMKNCDLSKANLKKTKSLINFLPKKTNYYVF